MRCWLGSWDLWALMYRDPAFRIWEEREGDRWRHLCLFLGHQPKLLFEERHHLEPPVIPDDPRPSRPAIPQGIVLHWISAIDHRVFRCDRCEKEWDEERTVRDGPPIEYTQWIVFG